MMIPWTRPPELTPSTDAHQQPLRDSSLRLAELGTVVASARLHTQQPAMSLR